MGNDFGFKMIFWIGLAFFVLFGVLLPVLLFFAALLEKRHVRTLHPPSAQGAGGQVVPPVVETIAAHFQPLGRYDALAAGKKPDPIFLLLSGDGQILVIVWLGRKDKVKKYELISRMLSGPWLVTADMIAVRDLSGLRWEEMLPDAPLYMGLHHHRDRLRRAGQPSVPFSAESVLADYADFEQRHVNRLKELKLARLVGPGQEKWVFTIRGAAKVAWQATGIMARLREDKKRVDALKEQLGAPLPLKS